MCITANEIITIDRYHNLKLAPTKNLIILVRHLFLGLVLGDTIITIFKLIVNFLTSQASKDFKYFFSLFLV